MLALLKKLSTLTTSNSKLVSFIHSVASQPTLVAPEYADAYVMGALQGVPDPEQSAKSFVNGEKWYQQDTAMDVSQVGSTAIIEVKGGLVARHEEGLCGSVASYEGLLSTLDTLYADDSVTDIVARFSTGGGVTTGMIHASNQIRNMRGKGKGLYAIADTHALSAGYGLLSAFEHVWAAPDAAVGSIGVYLRHVSREKANEAAGIDVTYVYAGEFKVAGNPDASLDEQTKAHYQSSVDKTYKGFTQLVADNMGLSRDAVVNTKARWYTSGQVETGLVHKIGSFSELLSEIKRTQTMSDPTTPAQSAADRDALKAELKIELEAEAKADLDRDNAQKATIRKDSIEALCTAHGVDAESTKAYVDSTKDVATVAVALKELDEQAEADPINTAGTSANGAAVKDVWAGIDWSAAA